MLFFIFYFEFASSGLTKKQFLFSRRGSLMNRRVTQSIDNMNFNSAKLSVKLCETLRDMLFFYFLVRPSEVVGLYSPGLVPEFIL